jgi:CPA1 family monovalent cation:H+ antiporter
MEVALLLVLLAVVALAGAAVAAWLDLPGPILLIAVGVAGSYLPGVPEVHLNADVVMLGLLPPLLYAAALETSLVDFKAHRRPILLLSVGLVVFTTIGVGVFVHDLLDVSWPTALAIGAVVSPPDAVAATAIGRRIGLPRRLVTILEGESLLNDATALVALRTAIAAGVAGGVTAVEVGVDFLVAAGGGVAVGLLTYAAAAKVRSRMTDPLLDTGLSFVIPFAAYLAAEAMHASGVLAVVVAGLLLGHRAPILQSARSRIAERTTWRTVAFLLENTVFLLIGLQARWLLGEVSDGALSAGRIVAVCLGPLVAVVVLRLLWVFAARWLLVRPGPDPTTGKKPPWSNTFLLGWAGMRGVVTLAAAFVLPLDTEYREVLLLVAFTVVAGTLVIQGLSLPWLARRLGVSGPDPVSDALARADLLQQAARAGEAELGRLEYDDPHGVAAVVRRRLDERTFAAWERLGTTQDAETPSELYSRLRLAMLQAERGRVLEIRSRGQVPADVVSEVLTVLDVEESMLDVATTARQELIEGQTRTPLREALCRDLEVYTVSGPDPAGQCDQCVAEGSVWVSLRRCLECGQVGCCDSSPRQHASGHFLASGHPVVASAEPGESWRWCYRHQALG